ncbi:MAG TPA: hypothetical protein VHA80_03310 [Solirubrobacterales bacterium]|nr:hypothetical protein [Solirubrobacterales bacterium]
MSAAASPEGVIYLIHLDGGLRVRDGRDGPVLATHYLGWTPELARRIEEHARGRGSAFMAEVVRRGITWRVARYWSGTRRDERRIKRQRNAPEFCPCCERAGRNHRRLRRAVGLVETYRDAVPGSASTAPVAGGVA